MRAAAVALSLALAVTVADAGPDRFTDGPGGRLTLLRSERPNRDVLNLLGRGYAQVFWIVTDSEGSRSWFRFAAEWDTVFVWMERWTVVATMRDGREVEAADVYVATPGPTGIPLRLGTVTREVDPNELERKPWRKRPAVPVYVGFPEVGMELGEIAGVQVRKRTAGIAAPIRAEGSQP